MYLVVKKSQDSHNTDTTQKLWVKIMIFFILRNTQANVVDCIYESKVGFNKYASSTDF